MREIRIERYLNHGISYQNCYISCNKRLALTLACLSAKIAARMILRSV